MPPIFALDVETDPASRRATLSLSDDAGRHLATHGIDLDAHPPARWEAAFDTRKHVRLMARTAPRESAP